MTARYAIYYAPTAQSDLWRKASAWIGRDAYTGVAIERPTLAGLDGLDLATLTAAPRGYGFHATLTAPFELAAGATEADLLAAADVVFTGGHSIFEAKAGCHGNIHPFPSSVDTAHFSRARATAPSRNASWGTT